MNKERYYIDGPGEVLIVDSAFSFTTPKNDLIIAVVTAKTASFSDDVSMESVTGGRSLAPRRKFVTGRTTTFELEDCEIDFRYKAMQAGASIVTEASTAWSFGEDAKYQVPADTAYTVTLDETPIAGTLVVIDGDGTVIAAGTETPGAGEYVLAGAVLTFNVAQAGLEFTAIFQFATGATTQTVSVLNDAMPTTVKLYHKQPVFDGDNNVLGHQYIEIYKAQPDGTLSEAYTEKAAAVSKLTFEVLDSGRSDKKLVDHKFVPVAAA